MQHNTNFYIQADDKDPDITVLTIDAPQRPGLPSKEYYQDEGIVRSYSETIGKVLAALLDEANQGSDYYTHLSALRNKNLVKAVVDLETKLAHATPDAEDADDVTKYYNPMGLAEANTLIPELSIFYVMQDLLRHGYMPNRIIVASPSYLKAVTDVIMDATAETLQAYFVWKTVQAFAYKVEDDALKPLLRFNNELQGKDPDASEERWRTCVRAVDSGLGTQSTSCHTLKIYRPL